MIRKDTMNKIAMLKAVLAKIEAETKLAAEVKAEKVKAVKAEIERELFVVDL
jgi:hypothetical protein